MKIKKKAQAEVVKSNILVIRSCHDYHERHSKGTKTTRTTEVMTRKRYRVDMIETEQHPKNNR